MLSNDQLENMRTFQFSSALNIFALNISYLLQHDYFKDFNTLYFTVAL